MFFITIHSLNRMAGRIYALVASPSLGMPLVLMGEVVRMAEKGPHITPAELSRVFMCTIMNEKKNIYIRIILRHIKIYDKGYIGYYLHSR